MHLGMTGKLSGSPHGFSNSKHVSPGWVHIENERTAYTNYYKKMKPNQVEDWPPKHWKFRLETYGEPSVRVAFTDPRRFGRVRLVHCPGESIRSFSPLVENGPDPVVDAKVFTEDYLREKMRARHVPIKAFLLDQTMISGIGNWVGDEVLYHAKLHPEQYCNEFDDQQVHTLFESIHEVCTVAVDKLGDSDVFPDHWMFNYRWGKGTKGATSHLPNGEKLSFLTVGGRTSCYVPSLQKKTGGATITDVEAGQKPKQKIDVKPEAFGAEGKPAAIEFNATESPPKKRKKSAAKENFTATNKRARNEKASLPVKTAPAKDNTQMTVLNTSKYWTSQGGRRSSRILARSTALDT
jgi:formamidopyrimidine-DNA glycosylase